jgi:hypothetical protein
MEGYKCPICRCNIIKTSYRKIKKEKKEQTNDVVREISEDIRNVFFDSSNIHNGNVPPHISAMSLGERMIYEHRLFITFEERVKLIQMVESLPLLLENQYEDLHLSISLHTAIILGMIDSSIPVGEFCPFILNVKIKANNSIRNGLIKTLSRTVTYLNGREPLRII